MERRNFLKQAATAAAAAAAGAAVAPAAGLLAGSPSKSTLWGFQAPVLDQGQIGSCTGNAVTQWSNTDYARRITGRKAYLTETDAVEIYKLATKLDGFPGEYPRSDTGSTGDSACDAAVQIGLLVGYRNVRPTVAGIVSALQKQPLIVGSQWLTGMFNTDASGMLDVSGTVAGGHEYTILGFDTAAGTFECLNSWSDRWGLKGRFHIRDHDLVRLLGTDADSSVTAPIARDF